MKNYKRFITATFLFIFIFCLGCKKDIQLPDSIVLREGTPDSLAVSAAGGEYSIKFNSSSNWAVTSSPSWVENMSQNRGSAGNAEVLLKVQSNLNTEERKGHVTISCGISSVRLTVWQSEAGAIILSQKNYNLSADEAKIIIEFKANIDFDILMPSVDWIIENTTKALQTYTREFIISKSNDDNSRSASIVIKSKTSDIADTVRINQTGVAIERERAYLLEIYKKLSGDRWDSKENWLTSKPVGEWYGITADQDGRVIALDLRTNWLIGEFPVEICSLIKLKELKLGGSNTMQGEIPKEIGNLTSLEYLSLTGNRLSGSLPSELCNLAELKFISLESNAFIGEIPKNIGKLTKLEVLLLDNNMLTGEIPQSICNLQKINSIILNNNKLTGSIPAELFNLPALENLGLENNQLSGSIPTTIGNAKKLIRLSFINNNLTGSVPQQFTQIIDQLNWNSYNFVNTGIQGNRLSGSLDNSLYSHSKWGKIWRKILPQQQGFGFNLTGISLPGYDFTVKDVNCISRKLSDIYTDNKYTVLLQWSKENYLIHQLAKALEQYKSTGLQVVAFDNGELTENTTKKLILNTDLKNFINFLSYDHSSFNIGDANEEVYNAIKNSGCKGVQAEVMDGNGDILFSFQKGMGNDNRFNKVTQTELMPFLSGLLGSISPPFYESTDFSEDGKVITIQQATVGKGIDLVVMGDGFTDMDMATGGNYEKWTRDAIDHFFSVEPVKNYRNRFNVYIVKAVSKHQELIEGSQTALGTRFGEEVSFNHRTIKGDPNKCWEYAQKVTKNGVPIDPYSAIIINVLNSNVWAGTANMFQGMKGTIAHCSHPIDNPDDFGQIVIHEAVGHGLGKLADEYYSPGAPWYMPEWKKQELQSLYDNYGWYSNIDFTKDPQKIRWSWFLSDEKYKSSVGIFEGAFVDYTHDVFRPSENSIMNSYQTGFNAPSRNAIYKFIMLRSGEEYKFQDFIAQDQL